MGNAVGEIFFYGFGEQFVELSEYGSFTQKSNRLYFIGLPPLFKYLI